ncbi:unnamed protein product [Soboliphyme baturini]|uniref:beta-N-acetylhexosaminidase n=1 Tax=Soboliphyme baturini TaxID=241478 RepID=A0A183IGL5_9BILA|nr:unnamed protein product [Soboliphyme baturini]
MYQRNELPMNAIASVGQQFLSKHRIVHLDLKGAAPKLHFIKEFFRFIARFNATGVLIEWENMFPFKGELAVVRSKDAYSEADVRQMQQWASDFRLEIIPLVQTVGHLEWILKHPTFRQLREDDRYPQVICLSNPQAMRLVKMAIDQVMDLQSDVITYFHIGADEAFQVRANCSYETDRSTAVFNAVIDIADYVKVKYNKKILMWHDMLQNIDPSVMKEYNLGNLVEPVVWAYAESLDEYLLPEVWSHFREVFPFIWGASAFKGADGANRYHSNIVHYLQNHISWISQMNREHSKFEEFRGIFLTGWQRYDHFGVLCELLVVGMPSLAVNLLTLQRGFYDSRIDVEIGKLLNCKTPFRVSETVNDCDFPGSTIYYNIQAFYITQSRLTEDLYEDHARRGWLGQMNLYYNYSSPWYLNQLLDKSRGYVSALKENANGLEASLPTVYFPDTVTEFMFEYIDPVLNRLYKMVNALYFLLPRLCTYDFNCRCVA